MTKKRPFMNMIAGTCATCRVAVPARAGSRVHSPGRIEHPDDDNPHYFVRHYGHWKVFCLEHSDGVPVMAKADRAKVGA